ncbi:MAG: hypothetical protein WCT53_01415 [Candidatus Gracilibacteria bacterium]
MADFNKNELKILQSLDTPAKIQDFVNSLEVNFDDSLYLSPKMVLKTKKAQCFEGAVFAAAALRMHGFTPYIMMLVSEYPDENHALAVFKKDDFWGAITKTNHAVLRYREPVYANIRELVMSYFHEYFTDDGKKRLRGYSDLVDLSLFDYLGWMTTEKPLVKIADVVTETRHYAILNDAQIKDLRKADMIEIEAGKLVDKQKK